MNEITHFRGILPPTGANPYTPPSHQASPDGLILNALCPLRNELDAALARGDQETALQIAYGALSQVADALAAYRGDLIQSWQVRIHALLVELEALPLQSQPDGTLAEQGTAVQISYRNWVVNRAEAATWARTLTERCKTLWPGAWIVLPPTAFSNHNSTSQLENTAAQKVRP